MKITVLSGSPKGEDSVTLQYVKYIQKHFQNHELTIYHVAQQIHKYEKNPEAFEEVIESVRNSDGVLWAFPLYVFLIHGGYKRFIELLWERGKTEVFRGKYAGLIATSIHFFDHMAVSYMNGICDDLDMQYYGYHSAEMREILEEKGRKQLLGFAQGYFNSIDQKHSFPKTFSPVVNGEWVYKSQIAQGTLDTQGKKIVLLTDENNPETNLGQMIQRFSAQFKQTVEIINLSQKKVKGSCLGCIQCGYDNHCVYEGRDDVIDIYEHIKTFDIIVFAGAIRERGFSSLWKTFIDRRFYKTHQPHFNGIQVAYLISGPFGQLGLLRDVLQADSELNQSNLVGVVTDESQHGPTIEKQLETLGQQLIYNAVHNISKPQTFLGVGGNKIFRDEIWGRLRGVFRADHLYYKAHGNYDFPQKDWKGRIEGLTMVVFNSVPSIRTKVKKNMRKLMVSRYRKALDQ